MKRSFRPWLVALALASVGVTQAFAGPLPGIEVTPDEGFPGDPFTVSGGGCPPLLLDAQGVGSLALGNQIPLEWSVELSMSGGPEAQSWSLGTATPDQNGDWVHPTSVPLDAVPSATPGDYDINAVCVGTFPEASAGLNFFAQGPPTFEYASHPFTVLAEEEEPPPDEPEQDEGVGDAGLDAPDPVEVQPAFTG